MKNIKQGLENKLFKGGNNNGHNNKRNSKIHGF